MARKYALPTMVTGPADVSRLLLEMEALEEYMSSAAIRKKDAKLPKTSRTLEVLADTNDADLSKQEDRHHLTALLESVQQHAPVLHISFASEPSAAFTAKIVTWLRANISQYVLVQIGLQPSIAAGCVVRTTNKVFDFSIRRYLKQHRTLLLDSFRSLSQKESAQVAPAAPKEVAS